ncbi:Jerky -like [Chionoecetes opilio]|uniref:Jerky -like n=1 Tax=Chionoecetes opilio TaxID=41210 RepID=A0A8J4YKP7_CHIOP|nr:Jerky -like [Chionoecetes opilio]
MSGLRMRWEAFPEVGGCLALQEVVLECKGGGDLAVITVDVHSVLADFLKAGKAEAETILRASQPWFPCLATTSRGNILTTDRTNLEKAFNHRIETGCSIRTACNLFGVKVSTLGEHFIEEYSIKISRMFYGLSTRAFRRMVLKYAEAVGSPAISDVWRRVGMATRDWYYGYMFRHPRLALKAPEGMSLARAMAFNRVNVEVFFKAYVEAVERHSFMPARIFNLDESGLSTVMKPCKVVCEKGRPVASQVARERGNHMTFVGIVNAAGHGFPPVFIIARKKMHADFQRGTTPGTTVLLQANGWMDHECFVQTLEHLHKVSYSSMENKILLIMDNAECHMSIHAAEYAIQHGIVIVTLPPHTTAKLQPLDVSVFGPFKSVLRSIQDDFKLSNTHVPITEHMLPEMACKAWDKVCNVTNITNGFRATGIFPVNRNIFPDDAFAGQKSQSRPLLMMMMICHKLLPHP